MTNQVAKKQMPAFLVLTIICVIAALALAATNAVTKGPIKEHAMAAQREAFGAVMTADEYVEMTIPEGSGVSALVEAKVNGETVGYCVAASSGGYAGPVAVTLGVGTDGKVTGAKIGDTSFAETSGFGSRWLAENQTEQFVGIDLREGGAIEALSGATVTSTAVLNASNAALGTVRGVLGIENAEPVLVFGAAEKKPVEQMTLTGDIHEGSAKGFASDVKVQLTMDDAGAITGLAIESSGETAGFGTRCMEDPTFAEQFIGKTAPFAIGENIDALAGATVTSTAVVNAVNAAVEAPANPDAVPFGSGAEEPAVETNAEVIPEGAKTASAPGFAGQDVGVTVTFNEDGTIATITIDNSKQVPPVCDMVNDEAFLAQFIGKKGPFTDAEIVTGATFTSQGVIDALNSLFAAEEAPAGIAYEATEQGFQSQVKVTVYADEAGVITGIVVESGEETPGFGTRCAEDEAFLNQFIGKTAPVEADVLSGATVTSNAVIKAVNAALPAPAVEEAPVEEVPAGTAYEATEQGFQSQVKVTVYADEAGVITGIVVESGEETPGFGTRCAEDEAFLNQFIGKTAPVEADVLAGATVTSNAVIKAVNAALPAPAVEEAPVEEVPAGIAYEATEQGFQSQVKVTVYADEAGVITGIVVESGEETPGFGTRCAEDEAFLNQFIGKTAPVEADVLSGATVTSTAVIKAVNAALPAPAVEEAPVEETDALVATVAAFGGENITVTVTFDEAGAVATLVVDASTQTPGLGLKCAEDEFVNQFIGQTGPFVLGENIDAVSYATITSQAVVDAVNSFIPTQDMSVIEETEAAYDPAADQTATVAAFGGENITVTVTFDEAGAVATLVVDASTQTPGLGLKCAEDEFVNQFIGQTGPFVLGENIDAVSYATITSQAVVDAVNSFIPTQDMSVTEETEAAADPAADQTATVAAFGGENITVTVTFDEAGAVATLAVDASTQTPGLGLKCAEDEFVNQFIGQTGPFVLGENIDAVSYATITSQAVVDAVNSFIPTQDMSVTEETEAAYDPAADQTATVAAFGGENITVTVTFDEAGAVATLVVDASTQTPGLGLKCAEDEFVNQFIGQTGPFVLGENIDAVSYATITSQAVVDAVNALMGK